MYVFVIYYNRHPIVALTFDKAPKESPTEVLDFYADWGDWDRDRLTYTILNHLSWKEMRNDIQNKKQKEKETPEDGLQESSS